MRLPTTVCLCFTLATVADGAPPWKIAAAPLTTPWTMQVDPANVLPGYPRPQLVRPRWLNLNGVWEFQPATAGEAPPFGRALSESILVPFPWESPLSGIRQQLPSHRAFYRRTFTVPVDWSGDRIRLHFEAVDWACTVYVNGRFAGQHRGGYDPFSFDVTPLLRRAGPQELLVEAFAPGNAQGIAVGKQANDRFLHPHRFAYCPSSGIWQTVWLEPVPARYIAELHIMPDPNRQRVAVVVNPDAQDTGLTVALTARDGTTVVSRATGAVNVPVSVRIPNPHLWWPNDPHLYNLQAQLLKDGHAIDHVASYFGMRTISLGTVYDKVRGPIKKIFLNGRFVFEIGPLDQGFWPDGIYTAPTDAAMRWDVDQIKAWGFDMVRKHVKVEPRRWYYYCDRAGLLVWQDMPSTNKVRTNAEQAQFEHELRRMITTHWNHPCIVDWILFNEHWGAYDVERLTRDVKALDPSRLVTPNSGIDAGMPHLDYEIGDIRDNHHYRPPAEPWPSDTRATVDGEFGAIGYNVSGHLWDPAGPWVHNSYSGMDGATAEYVRFFRQLLQFKQQDELSAAVYTQWTDVENEVNGLYTYDRRVEKLDRARVTKANRALWISDLSGIGGVGNGDAPKPIAEPPSATP